MMTLILDGLSAFAMPVVGFLASQGFCFIYASEIAIGETLEPRRSIIAWTALLLGNAIGWMYCRRLCMSIRQCARVVGFTAVIWSAVFLGWTVHRAF